VTSLAELWKITDLLVDQGREGDFTSCMRILPLLMLLCALVASGCAKKKTNAAAPAGASGAKAGRPVVTTEKQLAGRVERINAIGHFVVLSFPTGRMPASEQHLGLYRRDVKVGEVKVTGPQRGDNVVADIVSGEPEVSDEVREQ